MKCYGQLKLVTLNRHGRYMHFLTSFYLSNDEFFRQSTFPGLVLPVSHEREELSIDFIYSSPQYIPFSLRSGHSH